MTSALPHFQRMTEPDRAQALCDLEKLIEMAAQFNSMATVLATAQSIYAALGVKPAVAPRRERVWFDGPEH